MMRDIFYNNLLDNSGEIHFGRVGEHIVATWDGINPVFMTTQLFEDLDFERPEIELLSNDTFRICQYQFKNWKPYSKYNIIAFTIELMPEDKVPQEYWDRLAEWKVYQGIAT